MLALPQSTTADFIPAHAELHRAILLAVSEAEYARDLAQTLGFRLQDGRGVIEELTAAIHVLRSAASSARHPTPPTSPPPPDPPSEQP